jgi:hypothetical protein
MGGEVQISAYVETYSYVYQRPVLSSLLCSYNVTTFAPVFQLSGTITHDATTIRVELCPFNDRVLNRDLALLCTQVNQTSPRLPDGRLLSFTIRSTRCILLT